ncbi:MAG TPA: lysylphosphatidylglycerol synthase transmembrane domain-containing protein [Umezawaea sp.]|nr:lysylphosphatidylglycerol synthase transmembrane domain-containing protein [Umezawaea sp.]
MTTAEAEVPETGTTAAPKSTKALIITWARRLMVVVVIGFATYALVTKWNEVWHTLAAVAWQSSLLSQLAVMAAILFNTIAWQTIVDDLGKPIGIFRGAQICLVGGLGKYVPGSVWAYLLQMELGRKAGLPRARIFTGSLVQLGIATVASLLLGIIALPVIFAETPQALWLFALLPVGLAALHPKILTWGTSLVLKTLRRPPLDHQLKWSTIGKVLGFSLLAYAAFGSHMWLLANSVGAPGVSGLLLCIGAMAISMTAGLFAFFLPSGAGVREAVIVAVLAASGIDPVQGLAFAVASRLMFIVADVVTAGTAAAIAAFRRRTAPGARAPQAA